MSKYYAISNNERRRLGIAMGLSVLFIFFEFTFQIGPILLSIPAIILAITLASIWPSEMKKDESGRMYLSEIKKETDEFRKKYGNIEKHPLYRDYLDEDNSRNFMSLEKRREGFVSWINQSNHPDQDASHKTSKHMP